MVVSPAFHEFVDLPVDAFVTGGWLHHGYGQRWVFFVGAVGCLLLHGEPNNKLSPVSAMVIIEEGYGDQSAQPEEALRSEHRSGLLAR